MVNPGQQMLKEERGQPLSWSPPQPASYHLLPRALHQGWLQGEEHSPPQQPAQSADVLSTVHSSGRTCLTVNNPNETR